MGRSSRPSLRATIDCNFISSTMEKKVESLKTSSAAAEAMTLKTPQNYDGKELVRLFQNMSVKTPSSSSDSLWRSATNDKKPKMHKVQPSLRFKKRLKKKHPSALPLIRPSKLEPKTESGSEESRFSDFSAACSRELDTIVVAKPEDGENKSKLHTNRPQKKRKASASCAQQARNECSYSSSNSDSAAVDISIDFLTDYLEETILFPKKCPTWPNSCTHSLVGFDSLGKRNLVRKKFLV